MSAVHRCGSITVAVCWSFFAVVWVIGALYNARQHQTTRQRTFGNQIWIIAAVALWLVGRLVGDQRWKSLTATNDVIVVVGIVVLVTGLTLTVWARIALGTMWTDRPAVKEAHELRTSGPYAVTRHPIYTGLATMVLGTSLVYGLGDWLLALLFMVVFIGSRIHTEERFMSATFGDAYVRYCRSVPQFFPYPKWKRRMPFSA